MDNFLERCSNIRSKYEFKQKRIAERDAEVEYYRRVSENYRIRSLSLQFLRLISEDSTRQLRDYLELIINSTLDLIFGSNKYKFQMVYKSKTRKVNLVLMENLNGSWNSLDIKHQTGDGMGQIIAYIFTIVVTEVTNHRMLFIQDEILSGLHFKSVEMVQRCIKEFVKHGSQFVQVEYTFDKYGTIVDLERDPATESTRIVGRTDYGIDYDEGLVRSQIESNTVS